MICKEETNMMKSSFENYIVTQCNGYARTASFTFASKAGEEYNPLLLYGDIGTGKTHLAMAIYEYIQREYSHLNVVYITSEDFTNEAIENMRALNNAMTMNTFRDKYRTVDVLIFDDLDWLQNYVATREEVLHLVDSLLADGKKIVFTSSVCPADLFNDYPRFKSRLEAFYFAPIDNPDEELIVEIIKASIKEEDFNENIREYLVRKCNFEIRKLQGLINSLDMYRKINHKDVSIAEFDDFINTSSHKYKINV